MSYQQSPPTYQQSVSYPAVQTGYTPIQSNPSSGYQPTPAGYVAQQPLYVPAAQPNVVRVEFQEHRGPCSWLLNILWIIFGGGLLMCIIWGMFGCLFAITIIGCPLALQFFKLAGLALLPFGRVVTRREQTCGLVCGNLIWFPIGITIFFFHVVFAVVMFCTIIGIPFGLQHLKLAMLAVWPCGSEIATSTVAISSV